MVEREPSSRLRDLDARLERARGGGGPGRADADAGERGRGLGFALKVGVELVAALAVGVGAGLLADSWLGTAPWMLVAFFVLGAAAGMMNVYRVMSGMGQGVGYAAGRGRDRKAGGDGRR